MSLLFGIIFFNLNAQPNNYFLLPDPLRLHYTLVDYAAAALLEDLRIGRAMCCRVGL